MEREQLEQHQATIRGLRDTIGGAEVKATDETVAKLGMCIDGLAEVVGALIDEQLVAGEHAQAPEREPDDHHGG